MGGEEVILAGVVLSTKVRTRREIFFIYLQIQSPKSGNNLIVPLNLDADWSSPDDPARVLVFLSNLFVISIGDAFHSRCQCVSGERSNWREEGGIKLSIQMNIVKSRKHVIWNTSVI